MNYELELLRSQNNWAVPMRVFCTSHDVENCVLIDVLKYIIVQTMSYIPIGHCIESSLYLPLLDFVIFPYFTMSFEI